MCDNAIQVEEIVDGVRITLKDGIFDSEAILTTKHCVEDRQEYLRIIKKLYALSLLQNFKEDKDFLLRAFSLSVNKGGTAISDIEQLFHTAKQIESTNKYKNVPKTAFKRNADGISFVDLARLIIPSLDLPHLCMLYGYIESSTQCKAIDIDLIDLSTYTLSFKYFEKIPNVHSILRNAEREFLENPSIETLSKLTVTLGCFHSAMGTIDASYNSGDMLTIANTLSLIKRQIDMMVVMPRLIIEFLLDNPIVDTVDVQLEDSNAERRRRLVNEINHYKQFLTEEELKEVDELCK